MNFVSKISVGACLFISFSAISFDNASFKCESKFGNAIIFQNDHKHISVNFKPESDHEFRIHPYSSLNDEQREHAAFGGEFKDHSGIIENANIISNSHYIRTLEDDPRGKYFVGNGHCTLSLNDIKAGKGSLKCYSANNYKEMVSGQKLFHLNLNTNKFIYSYIGTFHRNNPKDYMGDSNITVTGTCKAIYE